VGQFKPFEQIPFGLEQLLELAEQRFQGALLPKQRREPFMVFPGSGI
jgi:hypothetical protein